MTQRTLLLGMMALVLVVTWINVLANFSAWFIAVPAIGTVVWIARLTWIRGPQG